MEFHYKVVLQNYPLLIDGFWITVQVTLIALTIGILFGAAICAMRLSGARGLDRIAAAYIVFFRATPEMVLIFWGYFCLPLIFQLRVSGLWTGSIALGLVTAAYLAEIFRAGINAVPQGEVEAATALGLKFSPKWRFVILPQAMRLMVPPLVNYFTELLKNTTLLSGIGVAELALQAYLLGGQTFRYVEFLSAIALIYFAIIFPLSLLSRRLEHREVHR
ncbi:MAG: amino acid ABC transporter permease [Hyphomicrobiales bacterium]|nr:amino acid ABC transporter permease [Hyphomicrobiales bacterium]